MNNVRGLYPPLYGAAPSGGGGGGGGGQHIQVDTLPEASLANKDKIVQYVGATTETLTNAYFYKCVENTRYDWEETEASETYTEAEELPTASAETLGTIYKVGEKYYQTIIVLSYSWNNVVVQPASKVVKTVVADGVKTYGEILNELMTNTTINIDKKYSLIEYKSDGNSVYINTAVLPNELYFFRSFYYEGIRLVQINAKSTNSTMYMDSASYADEKPTNDTIFKLYESEV